MTFGNYVLFNLLVAILVEGFSSEVCLSGCRGFIGHCFGFQEFTIGVKGLILHLEVYYWM